MQFRAVTGVRCRTLEDTRRLIAWTIENNEEIGDVARCGLYFDLGKPGLKQATPKRWELITSASFFITCSAALIVAVSAATITFPRAWVSVKNGSGKQLLLTPTDIEVWRTARHFTPADCKAESHQVISQRVGLPAGEVSIACGWFGDSDLQPLINHTLRQQRLALSFLIGQLLGYSLATYQWFAATRAARNMSKRLTKRESTQPLGSQLKPEVDLDT